MPRPGYFIKFHWWRSVLIASREIISGLPRLLSSIIPYSGTAVQVGRVPTTIVKHGFGPKHYHIHRTPLRWIRPAALKHSQNATTVGPFSSTGDSFLRYTTQWQSKHAVCSFPSRLKDVSSYGSRVLRRDNYKTSSMVQWKLIIVQITRSTANKCIHLRPRDSSYSMPNTPLHRLQSHHCSFWPRNSQRHICRSGSNTIRLLTHPFLINQITQPAHPLELPVYPTLDPPVRRVASPRHWIRIVGAVGTECCELDDLDVHT